MSDEDTLPTDWNDIQREYMDSRNERADISEEEARARQRRRLEELEEDTRRRANDLVEQGPPIPDFGPLRPPPLTNTHTWNDNTTITPGQIGDLGTVGYASVSTGGGLTVDETQMKRLIKEALKEMFEEDVSFMRWLHIKYMTIPVRQEEESVDDDRGDRSPSVSTPGGGDAGDRIYNAGPPEGGAGYAIGNADDQFDLGGVSLRSDVRQSDAERSTPPDQGGGQRSDHGGADAGEGQG